MTELESYIPFRTSLWKFYDSRIRESLEKCEQSIKTNMSNWVLAPNQQAHSFNSRPYFMILAFVMELHRQFYRFRSFMSYGPNSIIQGVLMIVTRSEWLLLFVFLGMPLEIAHGSLQMSVLYLMFLFYPSIYEAVITNYRSTIDFNCLPFSIIAFHLANIIRNWSDFPQKYLRVTIIFVLLAPTFAINVLNYLQMPDGYWRMILIHHSPNGAAILVGFLLGYYWVYRPQEETHAAGKWKNYAILLSILTAYFVVMEVSGIHMSRQEWKNYWN